jgi:hypothetical protein
MTIKPGYIRVRREWLETLARYAEEAERLHNNPLASFRSVIDSTKYLIAISQLIGFASSAKTLLKYGAAKSVKDVKLPKNWGKVNGKKF